MENYLESPFRGLPLDRQVTNPKIHVGRYSYFSGYYRGQSFDHCARFLVPDAAAGRLAIGSFGTRCAGETGQMKRCEMRCSF